MPRCTCWSVLTPFGDAAATLAALAAGTAVPRLLDLPLREQIARVLAPCRAAGPCDLVLFATTKGDADAWAETLVAGRESAGGPAQIAQELSCDLGIPAYAVSAACASGPAALAEAGRLVATGAVRRVLVIAADRGGRFVADGFAALKAIDADRCRPFDAGRGGLALGEGAVAMVVEAGEGAVQLLGWGTSMDANHLTGPSRDGAGLADACRQALRGGTCDAIVAHGTGTRYNDDSESLAYASLGLAAPVTGWKGVLGHSLGACGLIEAALCAEIVATGGALPGTAHLRSAGTAGSVRVLPAGAHAGPWQRLLSANAGFGGLNAAVVIGRGFPPTRLRLVAARLRGRVEFDHAGWSDEAGRRGVWTQGAAPGALPRLGSREVTGAVDPNWGRMDLACRLLTALVQRSGPHPESTALVLLTQAACSESDRAFETARRAGQADPRHFAYTLPTAPVGEASIRNRLRGPGTCLVGASDDQGRASVDALLAEGHPRVLLARVEADAPPHSAWIETWEAACAC